MRNRQDLYFMGEFCSGYARSVVWLLFAASAIFAGKKADKKAKSCLFKSGKSFVIMGLQQRERPARPSFMKQI